MNELQFGARRLMGGVAAAGTAALAGYIVVHGSPGYFALGLVGIACCLLIVRRPEIGALLIIGLTALLPRSVLFDRGLPLGGGALKITDLLLLMTLGAWAARRTVVPEPARLPDRWTTGLLAVFVGFAVISVITANVRGTPTKLSLLELRPLLSYLLVFPLVDGIRTWRQLERGIAALLAIAGAAAVVALWQYAHGVGAAATYAGGAVRVVDTVYLYPMLAIVWTPALLAFLPSPQLKRATVLLAALCLGGVFVTFARGAWLAIIVAAPLAFALVPAGRRARAVSSLLPIAALVAVALLAVNTWSPSKVGNPFQAGLDRIGSLGSTSSDVSAQHRFTEWRAAGHQIVGHPVTGIGLGSSISYENPEFSAESNTYGFVVSTYYIHDSYIWFALKLGLLGAGCIVLLLARTWFKALRGYRDSIDPRERLVLLGSFGSLTALFVLAVTGPHLNVDNATPAVAALIAAVEVARRLGREVAPS